jgi:hypothetical protein
MNGLFGDDFTKGDGPAVARRCTPAPCGSGPEGETCGTCALLVRLEYRNSRYLKCKKMELVWTHGAGSDVRAKWEACREWQRKSEGGDGR